MLRLLYYLNTLTSNLKCDNAKSKYIAEKIKISKFPAQSTFFKVPHGMSMKLALKNKAMAAFLACQAGGNGYNVSMILKRIARFYIEGFRSMTLGRTLWCIILIKLFIMFAVLKAFFFPSYLKGDAEEKGAAVSTELTARKAGE